MNQRHLPCRFRSLYDVAAKLPYKTRCGLHRADLGTYLRSASLCTGCFQREASKKPLTLDSAVQEARDLADSGGLLRQHDYHSIYNRIADDSERYLFNQALQANQLRVRTGAVDIVGEPPSTAPGDDGSIGLGILPGEQNDDLDGTTIDMMKPIHTEGELGHNLEDLTVAKVAGIDNSDIVALINEGLSVEHSQAIRYRFYAESVLGPYRESLAEEFKDHAAVEEKHASFLARRLAAIGGKPSFQVTPPKVIAQEEDDSVQQVLAEMYEQEQEGIDYYARLRSVLPDGPFRYAVEDILTAELEHLDDLARLGHSLHRQASLTPDDVRRWNETYADDNTSEGLERMGKRVAKRQSRIAAWQRRADAVKRQTHIGEIPISIEWNNGETRKGVGDKGPWERVMSADYGFIPDTIGSDGEPIDVYLGGTPQSRKVFVVNQMKDGAFDEEKVMLGFPSQEVAEATYRAHYPEGGIHHFGGITPYTMDEFLAAFVRKPSDDQFIPKYETITRLKELPKEADHGPGDADGCGDGKAPASPAKAPSSPVSPPKEPVDTSPVKSPAETVMKGTPGKMKDFHDQFWRLLGGPGQQVWSEKDPGDPLEDLTVGRVASVAQQAIYDVGTGPLADSDNDPEVTQRDHC